jgi:hypothetical protein
MRLLRRLPHLVFLVGGLLIGLALALPIDTTNASCPPPGEGRNMCLVQNVWAPALTTVALCLMVAWLVADLLFVRLPDLRAGNRRRRRPRAGHGREALERDAALRAATWGVLPPPRRPAARPQITVAAVTGGGPAVRPVNPLDLPKPPPGRGIRVVPGPAPTADKTLLAACWETATRRSAELIDQVALELGLARDRLRPVPVAEPDPLLAAATWSRAGA